MGDQSTPLTLELPNTQAAARPLATREHLIKVGGAILAAGVLVGAVGSLMVVTSRAPGKDADAGRWRGRRAGRVVITMLAKRG